MYWLDIVFFIKEPSDNFNINQYYDLCTGQHQISIALRHVNAWMHELQCMGIDTGESHPTRTQILGHYAVILFNFVKAHISLYLSPSLSKSCLHPCSDLHC